MKPLYQAVVKCQGGRNGSVKSSDGLIDFPVQMPKELGGKGGATNPEQLFAAGYAACFTSAMQNVARGQQLHVRESEVTASVTLGTTDDGGFCLAVKLEVKLPDTDRTAGEKLLRDAHAVCPYSRATRGNIPVELVLL